MPRMELITQLQKFGIPSTEETHAGWRHTSYYVQASCGNIQEAKAEFVNDGGTLLNPTTKEQK